MRPVTRSVIPIAALTLLLAASVVVFHSKYLINWDAGQFALGTIRYSLSDHTPHPPGYFLFVKLGGVLTALTGDVNISFIVIAAFASALALLFFYRALLIATGSIRTAGIAALFLFLNPAFLFSSRVALTYSFEALAISVSLLCISVTCARKNASAFIINCTALALIAGFRPSVVLASFPLLLFHAWQYRRNGPAFAGGLAAGALVLAAWVIPFTHAAGGLADAIEAVRTQAEAVQRTPVFDQASPALFSQSLLFSMNILLIFFLLAAKSLYRHRTLMYARVAMAAIASAVFISLFFIFFHFGEVGYMLALAPSLLFLLAPMLGRLKTGVLIALACAQLALFALPLEQLGNRKIAAANGFAIRAHDSRIEHYLSSVRAHRPADILVVVLRGQYADQQKQTLLYPAEDIRVLSYYLPDYALVDLLGTPGFYATVKAYAREEHSSNTIPFPKTARQMLVLADSINPASFPAGVEFHDPPLTPGAKNIYRADIATKDAFEFFGFSFVRAEK